MSTARTARRVRFSLAAASALVLGAFAAPAANAGVLVSSASSCDNLSLSQPFTPWADLASYVMAPGGTFEDGAAGWTLNGASVAAGNESYNVHGAGESNSLAIPSGASATSSSVCVGIQHPDLRFFARKTAGGPPSSLRVDVLFEDAAGNVQSLTIGSVSPSSNWQPTLPLPILVNLLPLLPGDHTAVAFRFTAQGGSYLIDDTYVDPVGHH